MSPKAAGANQIRIRVDQARLRDEMTVEEVVALEEEKVAGARAMLARFMVDEKGEYMDYDQAVRIVNKLKIRELVELIPTLKEAANGAVGADPKAPNGSTTSTATESPKDAQAG